jgi:polysaccharide export outer membrane protein
MPPLRLALTRAALVAVTLLPAGCASSGPSDAAATGSNPKIAAATNSAQLRPGDTLTISLLGVPDASSNPAQIDDQGFISLPYIGLVTAAGLTSSELSQSIRQTYIAKKIYTALDVSVAVTERYVYVGGEVQRPGRIAWSPDLTLSKAIQAAGGFTLYAKETKVTLTRDRKTYGCDVKLAQRRPEEDPLLFPGDSLQVPRSPF